MGRAGELASIHPRMALYRLRDACGLDPHPDGARVRELLAAAAAGRVAGPALVAAAPVPGGPDADERNRPVGGGECAARAVRPAHPVGRHGDPEAIGIGGHGENRAIYTGPEYESAADPGAERRSVHLATDVWTPAGMPVCAPLPGRVVIVRDNDVRLDYGPVVILEHDAGEGMSFYSLYGHLSLATLDQVTVGAAGRGR